MEFQSVEDVKREIAKLMNPEPESATGGAGGSSSSASGAGSNFETAKPAEKPKATDISHLIKRKKPDAPADDILDGLSPAKKPAV